MLLNDWFFDFVVCHLIICTFGAALGGMAVSSAAQTKRPFDAFFPHHHRDAAVELALVLAALVLIVFFMRELPRIHFFRVRNGEPEMMGDVLRFIALGVSVCGGAFMNKNES